MTTDRDEDAAAHGSAAAEAMGGAAEVLGVGLEGLAHAGPLAVIVALVALIAAPIGWLVRRRTS
jgi:L-serine deaminase